MEMMFNSKPFPSAFCWMFAIFCTLQKLSYTNTNEMQKCLSPTFLPREIGYIYPIDGFDSQCQTLIIFISWNLLWANTLMISAYKWYVFRTQLKTSLAHKKQKKRLNKIHHRFFKTRWSLSNILLVISTYFIISYVFIYSFVCNEKLTLNVFLKAGTLIFLMIYILFWYLFSLNFPNSLSGLPLEAIVVNHLVFKVLIIKINNN